MKISINQWGRFPYIATFAIACVIMVLTGHPGWATVFFIMLVLMFD